jgi:hypothetical protein
MIPNVGTRQTKLMKYILKSPASMIPESEALLIMLGLVEIGTARGLRYEALLST